MATNKNNAKAPKANSNMAKAKADALSVMAQHGQDFAKSETALLDAAIDFAKFVKEGIAAVAFNDRKKVLPDDTAEFFAAYESKLFQPLSEASRKGRLSQFRAFAHPAAIDRHATIKADLQKFMSGKSKKECGDKDLFHAHLAIVTALKDASDKKKPMPTVSKAIETVIVPKVETTKGEGAIAAKQTPEQVLEAQKRKLVELATEFAAMPAKGMPKGMKAALQAVLNLKWNLAEVAG